MDKTAAPIISDRVDPRNTSVVDVPSVQERQTPHSHPLILTVAAKAQAFTPWGVNVKRRDAELRSFWHTESWLASVVYLVSIRNAGFKWEIVGEDRSKPAPRNTTRMVEGVLNRSNRGKGWSDLVIKTCIDLYTCDNAAFWEIIRINNTDPTSPVVNISHLDSASCWRTGDPEYPVIYTDRYGREKLLRYWQVRTLEEFPSPVEDMFGAQYSALTRCLLAAEIIQDIAVYKHEKVGGNFTRAIDFISGVTNQNINDALMVLQEQNFNRGLSRYSQPVIVAGLDPTSPISHQHIDLASLPDNFDEDTSFKWYVAQLAAAFGVDYQEIAPLMTGSLGSSQQSEIMHLKTRGKGPALFMSLIESTINTGLIPGNVEFKYLEHDIRSEVEKAEAAKTRAITRSMQIRSGELDAEAARDMAVLHGDIPEWIAEEVAERGEAVAVQGTGPKTPAQAEVGPTQVQGGLDRQNEAEDQMGSQSR